MTADEIKIAVANLPSFIKNEEIDCYFKYANLINNGVIFDLGTGWGKSMVALALSNSTNIIHSCDPGIYPIYQGWATNKFHYENKIKKMIKDFNLSNVVFYLEYAEVLVRGNWPKINLLHLDSWVEMRNIDSTLFLKKWIDKVKVGGYLLIRNYGYGDRQAFTDSVNKVTEGLKKIEQMGLITIWQK